MDVRLAQTEKKELRAGDIVRIELARGVVGYYLVTVAERVMLVNLNGETTRYRGAITYQGLIRALDKDLDSKIIKGYTIYPQSKYTLSLDKEN